MTDTAGTAGTAGAAPATATDEAARFRVFTAFGIALTALFGGGVFAPALQFLSMKLFNDAQSDQIYFTGLAASPLVMALVALWLGSSAMRSTDPLVRPLARATLVIGALAAVGAFLLLAVTIDTP